MPKFHISLTELHINLPLLLTQKRALLRVMERTPRRDRELLEGVLNLLDSIHDQVDPPSN